MAGPVSGKTLLVQGGAGAVGTCAIRLAQLAGARVIVTESDREIAMQAGADEVLLADATLSERVLALAPDGVDHIVEVTLDENVQVDTGLLAQGGLIAAYATKALAPEMPFSPLVSRNASVHSVGSDDVPAAAKAHSARDLNRALEAGWSGLPIAARHPLDDIVLAHELVEHPTQPGRVILTF